MNTDQNKKLKEEEEKKIESSKEVIAKDAPEVKGVEIVEPKWEKPIRFTPSIERTNEVLKSNAPTVDKVEAVDPTSIESSKKVISNNNENKIEPYKVEIVEPKWNRPIEKPTIDFKQKEIDRKNAEVENAKEVVREDRSANALRDYGRYFRNNSYGATFDQEQLQTSMQPEDIMAFQKKHGIPVTGWVGKRTYAKLKEEWEKANNTEEAKEKEAQEAEDAVANDPTLSPAEQALKKKEFAKNAEVRAWGKKWSSADPKDFSDDAVKELQAILNKYGYNTKNDDIFGRQTMWHFMNALETQDPEMSATLKNAGIKMGDDGSVTVERPYDHIMDYLNDKQDRERAMYERDYALRKSQRDKKMQALNDVFSMIKDTIVASGGVKPESRDTSDKYKAIQKYAQEANEKYRQYEEDRRKKIVELAKANEDERQRRAEEDEKSDRQSKQWQQQFEEDVRQHNEEAAIKREGNAIAREGIASKERLSKEENASKNRYYDILADKYANDFEIQKEKNELQREGYKLQEKIKTMETNTKTMYYEMMGNYYSTKAQNESLKATQKALANNESVTATPINGKQYLTPTNLLIKIGSKYGVKYTGNTSDPKKVGIQVYQDIMNKIGNNSVKLQEFEADLVNAYYQYVEPNVSHINIDMVDTVQNSITDANAKGGIPFEQPKVDSVANGNGKSLEWATNK